jgi:predicted flap endonuclease-1-like 5' DNA nuclease
LTGLNHVLEVALLIAAAYLFGCVLGYVAHRLTRLSVRGRRVAETAMPKSIKGPADNLDLSGALPVAAPSLSPARRLAGASSAVDLPAVSTAAARRPPQLPAPRDSADDLKKIKGIGKKTESALHDLGIYHFTQIAAWEQAHIDWLEGRIALKGRIRREQWVEQATLLMTAPVA